MFDTSQAIRSRRQFLRTGLAVATGVATLGPRNLLAADLRESTRWAFLSDTHVASDPDNRYRGFYPYRNLQEVTAQIADDLPDGLVITGDLARLRGQAGAYENVRSLLAPVADQRPICLGLGNHDDRDDFLSAFEDSYGGGMTVGHRYVVAENLGPVRLIVLDTLLYINWNPGMLGRGQCAWLQAFLQMCDDTPTILFFHHTPGKDLLDTRRLFDIIGPMAKVKAIVYGHSHRYRFSEEQGIHLINLPATGYNMSDREPVGWVEARLTTQGGEFRLHAIGGNRENDGRVERLRWRS